MNRVLSLGKILNQRETYLMCDETRYRNSIGDTPLIVEYHFEKFNLELLQLI